MSSQKFCVYLIVYHGNKLPMFYIGQTQIEKLKNGYRGSVCQKEFKTIWKEENRINPQLFTYKVISLHYTRKEALQKELQLQKSLGVVNNELYANKSLATREGFFGRDVSGKKNPNYGKKWSLEQKEAAKNRTKHLHATGILKPRPAMLGQNNPRFGDKRQTFKNNNGDILLLQPSDEKVLSGEYVGISTGLKLPKMGERKRKDPKLKKYKQITFENISGEIINLDANTYQHWLRTNKINIMDYIRKPNQFIQNFKLTFCQLNEECNMKQPIRKPKFKFIVLKCPDQTVIKLEAPYTGFLIERKINTNKLYTTKKNKGYEMIDSIEW